METLFRILIRKCRIGMKQFSINSKEWEGNRQSILFYLNEIRKLRGIK